LIHFYKRACGKEGRIWVRLERMNYPAKPVLL